jgi:hypothetical protein
MQKTKFIFAIAMLTCLGSTLELRGQSYSMFQSDQQYFFSTQGQGSNEIRTVGFDSVTVSGNDSVLYTYRLIRDTIGSSCAFLSNSWAGGVLVKQSNGDHLFTNIRNDTIRIKTQAEWNEHWISYQGAAGDYVVARIDSIGVWNTLGFSDSVKIIRMQHLDAFGVWQPSALDTLKIILSKEHGCLAMHSMLLFPDVSGLDYYSFYQEELNQYYLTDNTSLNIGEGNFSYAEIYDFQVDDELHISVSWGTVGVNPWETTVIREISNISLGKIMQIPLYIITYPGREPNIIILLMEALSQP